MKDIYIITNLLNGKQYVGQTSIGYKNRFNRHCRSYNYGVRTEIACAIHEFGKENFSVSLLKTVKDDDADFWEIFYIRCNKTHISFGGYNMSFGGKHNPMDDPFVKEKHLSACSSAEFREKQHISHVNKKHSDETKQKCRDNTLMNLDRCLSVFREYNERRKVRVGMIENDVVIKEFDSLSDACRYLGVTDKSATSHIKRYADKYNKSGKRAKFLGYSWTLL